MKSTIFEFVLLGLLLFVSISLGSLNSDGFAGLTGRSLTSRRLERDQLYFHMRSSRPSRLGSNKATSNTTFTMLVRSGASTGVIQYLMEVEVGSPSQKVNMTMDTASGLVWMQCAPCIGCSPLPNSVFQPMRSSTYKYITCESSMCNKLQASKVCSPEHMCIYNANYGKGAISTGRFSMETFTLGGQPFQSVAMGCGTYNCDNLGKFGGFGVCGLDKSPLSLPSQIREHSFSYCLPRLDKSEASHITFGAVNVGSLPQDTMVTSLLENSADPWYHVPLTKIRVAGSLVSIPTDAFTGGAILDTGTAFTRLYTRAYVSLRDAFRKSFPFQVAEYSTGHFDTCYNLTDKMDNVQTPSVELEFEDRTRMSLPIIALLYEVEDGIYCFPFVPHESKLNVIGSVQQQGFGISIDTENMKVWITPNLCI